MTAQTGTVRGQRLGSCPCGSCLKPCFEQPAVCPDRGAGCEPDDHCEPPTVDGEVL